MFSESNTSLAGQTTSVLFKRGSRNTLASLSDEETPNSGYVQPKGADLNPEIEEKDHSLSKDIFSWQHITYSVPIHGDEDRKLLSDVSGYVAPGKLTALMGESGAGKTTLLNVLAQRINIGVVAGDSFVNGQAPPKDFQSQTCAPYLSNPFIFLNRRELLQWLLSTNGHSCFDCDCSRSSTLLCEASPTSLGTFDGERSLVSSSKLISTRRDTYSCLSVEKCLRWCGLEAYAEASVGSISVELRKRTTIGVELAAKVSEWQRYDAECSDNIFSRNCCCSWMNLPQGLTPRAPGA